MPNNPTTHLPYWLAASYLPDVGPRKFTRWLTHFDNIQALFTASTDALTQAGISAQHIQAIRAPDWQSVERDLTWAQTAQQHILTLQDASYPSLLKEISDPPLVLYVQGNVDALHHRQLAIVGSRRATPAGLNHAETFAATLVQAGFVITSGLALGIDAASHRGALQAKGLTIAVMGTGLQHIYPSAHRGLVAAILNQQGAIVSEFPLTMSPRPENFPRRNRVIAGLSMGVLVVEAALKSGSLVTARHALEQGREVFAIPGSIHNFFAHGCHHLLKQGAKLVETATDILEELNNYPSQPLSTNPPSAVQFTMALPAAQTIPPIDKMSLSSQVPAQLSKNNRALLEQIDYDVTPIDAIILRSGLTASEVSSMLLTLELAGYIQSCAGGYMRCC